MLLDLLVLYYLLVLQPSAAREGSFAWLSALAWKARQASKAMRCLPVVPSYQKSSHRADALTSHGHVEASNTNAHFSHERENKATDNTKAQTFSADTESNSTV